VSESHEKLRVVLRMAGQMAGGHDDAGDGVGVACGLLRAVIAEWDAQQATDADHHWESPTSTRRTRRAEAAGSRRAERLRAMRTALDRAGYALDASRQYTPPGRKAGVRSMPWAIEALDSLREAVEALSHEVMVRP
jgi:hypothetical protein